MGGEAPRISLAKKNLPKATSVPPLQASWTLLRDAALDEGTKISTTSSRTISASSLLGSYFGVWDSHTGWESFDDTDQEISYLHLTMAASSGSTNSSSETEPKVDGETNGTITDTKVGSTPQDATFADIHGRFRWWRMVGSFKGLYKPVDAGDNLWLFGGVTWEHLSDEEGGPELSQNPANRNAEDFGLAAIVTLDKAGRPFLEMLYNATLYYASERENRERRLSQQSGKEMLVEESTDIVKNEYVRVLWKKQEVAGGTDHLVISHTEAQRLTRQANIDLSENLGEGGEFSDDCDAEGDDDLDVEATQSVVGFKREADEALESDAGLENPIKKVRVE